MAIERVGTADDREVWLEQRKNYLTASSIFTWRGVDVPSWWSDRRSDILAEKFEGVEKVFDYPTQVSINHGSFSEQDIARKFEHGIGYRVETDNSMFTNSEFPGLAVTVDGYVHADEDRGEPDTNYCQDPEVFPALRARIAGRGTGVLELKRSVSTGWQKETPKYYISQVMAQLHLLDLEWGVICADTVCRIGRRTYWDMRPYLVKRDPRWAGYLRQAGEEFLAAKESHDAG